MGKKINKILLFFSFKISKKLISKITVFFGILGIILKILFKIIKII